ncbi:hypothetical protein ONE63_003778 [Megalurothrips usitatus]|uniref:C2H2-type domain-containing protein n=1 Tax=Megalurothrips usitatus TaxID=439358 RepID=A0AAV7X428_9NEOP|nr:hypothetical protein ONE63_003778 [Megalurothrips usitatus]
MRRRKEESRPTMEEESYSKVKRKTGKAFCCTMCMKPFKSETKLHIHVRSHTGETPYACPHCEKAFAQNAALKVHIRTHTGERPFTCDKCGRTFARADHLRQHDRTHTGEKPYECPMCGKSFATWSAVSRHKSEHLSRDSFACSVCHKTFARSDNLRAHVQKTHKVALRQEDVLKTEVGHPTSDGLPGLPNPNGEDQHPQEKKDYSFEPHFLANMIVASTDPAKPLIIKTEI